ncbi:MAG TPA: Rho termination protein [Desulfobacteraceae bacterium]|nr:Rho termination protein [Desulfobacteraceae bacterium]
MGKKDENKEKPLAKMTAKELRELAMTVPGISGVHGMNKDELVSEIKKSRGIAEEVSKHKSSTVREIKHKMRTVRVKHLSAVEANDMKMAKIYKRRMINLKKKTRRVA